MSARPAPAPAIAARALALLAERRGEAHDAEAAERLRALLDDDDPALVALAIRVADELPRLLTALTHDDERVRRAAALRLGAFVAERDHAEPVRQDLLRALAERAATDEARAVRLAAVRALGSCGRRRHSEQPSCELAISALGERRIDPDPRVRTASGRALVQVDRERAFTLFGDALTLPPSGESVELARALIFGRGTEPIDSIAEAGFRHLLAGLRSPHATLRGQAAVALLGLPTTLQDPAPLLEALRHESDASVRLALARGLVSGEAREIALDALRTLAAGADDTLSTAQAALMLALAGEPEARLRSLLTSPSPIVRRVVAAGLARELGHPEDVVALLDDPDPGVRLHVAGALLAGPRRLH